MHLHRLPSESFRDAVNRVTVQHAGEQIERHPGTEPAAGPNGGERAHKVHAAHIEQPVEIVVLRYEDLVAVRILQVRRPETALFRVVAVQGICEYDDQRIMILP